MYDSKSDYPKISFISLCIKDKFGEIPTLILLTYDKLESHKRYAVVYSSENYCMFYGSIFSYSEKKRPYR